MYLEILKQEKRFGLCLWTLNEWRKGTTNDFSSYKLTSKMSLVYLEVKLQQYSCVYCIYKLKCHKTVEISYLEVIYHCHF